MGIQEFPGRGSSPFTGLDPNDPRIALAMLLSGQTGMQLPPPFGPMQRMPMPTHPPVPPQMQGMPGTMPGVPQAGIAPGMAAPPMPPPRPQAMPPMPVRSPLATPMPTQRPIPPAMAGMPQPTRSPMAPDRMQAMSAGLAQQQGAGPLTRPPAGQTAVAGAGFSPLTPQLEQVAATMPPLPTPQAALSFLRQNPSAPPEAVVGKYAKDAGLSFAQAMGAMRQALATPAAPMAAGV